jgi:DNA-binding IclR family transcriptional regulator
MLLPPARVAQERFGGTAAFAAAAGVGRRTVRDWVGSPRRDKRGRRIGGGGEIPNTEIMRRLLAAARQRGVALTEHELIYGVEAPT